MGGDFPRGSSPGQRESSKAQLLALRCGAGSVRRADMAEVGEAANDPLYALGLTHARARLPARSGAAPVQKKDQELRHRGPFRGSARASVTLSGYRLSSRGLNVAV